MHGTPVGDGERERPTRLACGIPGPVVPCEAACASHRARSLPCRGAENAARTVRLSLGQEPFQANCHERYSFSSLNGSGHGALPVFGRETGTHRPRQIHQAT